MELLAPSVHDFVAVGEACTGCCAKPRGAPPGWRGLQLGEQSQGVNDASGGGCNLEAKSLVVLLSLLQLVCLLAAASPEPSVALLGGALAPAVLAAHAAERLLVLSGRLWSCLRRNRITTPNGVAPQLRTRIDNVLAAAGLGAWLLTVAHKVVGLGSEVAVAATDMSVPQQLGMLLLVTRLGTACGPAWRRLEPVLVKWGALLLPLAVLQLVRIVVQLLALELAGRL